MFTIYHKIIRIKPDHPLAPWIGLFQKWNLPELITWPGDVIIKSHDIPLSPLGYSSGVQKPTKLAFFMGKWKNKTILSLYFCHIIDRNVAPTVHHIIHVFWCHFIKNDDEIYGGYYNFSILRTYNPVKHSHWQQKYLHLTTPRLTSGLITFYLRVCCQGAHP